MKFIKKYTKILLLVVFCLSLTSCSSINDAYFNGENSKSNAEIKTYCSEYPLVVDFIDVGEADSEFIVCNGETMLIDGGNGDDFSVIDEEIKSLGQGDIDVLVNTHAHEDHCGSLSKIVETYSVGAAIISPKSATTDCYTDFISALNSKNVNTLTASAGTEFSLGGADVEILGPVSESEELNNTSVVLRFTYEGISFLFTGDAEKEEESAILSTSKDVSADVLKVAHHGSSSSTSTEFLSAVNPKYAVISCGKGNSYGHPNGETLKKLNDKNIETHRTDKEGSIILAVDKEKNVIFKQ